MLVRELQQALRNLRRAPRVTAACVLTFALALAAAATLLNLLEAFVCRRLAVPAPHELVGLYPTTGEASSGFSANALQALRDTQQVLTGVCGVTAGYGALRLDLGSGVARQRPVEAVTGNCYQLLGVAPSLGRVITDHDAPLAGEPAPVALISDRVWRNEFAASRDVLGRTIHLEGTPLTIVGVLPASYRGVNADEAPDIALPITLPWKLRLQPPLAMHALGRLRPGISIAQAAAKLRAVWPDIASATQTAGTQPPSELRIVPLARGFSVLRERYRRPLVAVAMLAACLLLLASVNIGSLSLARLMDRRGALAVQLALGASRLRLALQLLFEAVVMAVVATFIAVPLSLWSAHIAGQSLWTAIRPLTVDPTPVAMAVAVTVGVALVAALLVSTPGLLSLALRDWDLVSRDAGHATRTHRRGLIAVQITVCFVLASGAALFAGNLYALRQLPLGYEPRNLQLVRLDSVSRAPAPQSDGYVDTLLARVAAIPGVDSAAIATSFGLSSLRGADTVPVSGEGATGGRVDTHTDRISPGFFRTAAIPLQQGREFRAEDTAAQPGAAILNRSLAERLFPNGDALGRHVHAGARVFSIIGIVANAAPGDPRLYDRPILFLPLRAAPPAPVVVLRVKGSMVPAAALQAAIEPLGQHAVARAGTMQAQVDRFLVQERLITSTSSLFALLALVICMAGLYAALSQDVIRRTREIGIRIAVGATPRSVRALIFGDAMWAAGVGMTLGVPVAVAASSAARSLLFEGAPPAPIALVATAAIIVVTTAASTAWPARRAARTEVTRALRAD